MAQRYVTRMEKDQALRYAELLKQEEPLKAEIALNQWALEYHIQQAQTSDPAQMQRLSTMIAGHTEQIRKLEETRHKMEHDERLSWTPRQVQNFVMAVAGIIDLYVPTVEQKKSIAGALQALLQNKKYIQYPDENSVGAVVTRLYDGALLTDG
jgi:hypothetical protein